MGSRRYSSPFPFANQNYNKDEISYETIQVNKLTYDDKILLVNSTYYSFNLFCLYLFFRIVRKRMENFYVKFARSRNATRFE